MEKVVQLGNQLLFVILIFLWQDLKKKFYNLGVTRNIIVIHINTQSPNTLNLDA